MHNEIEARFININHQELIKRLKDLGAIDKGESLLREVILYDAHRTWMQVGRFVRIRSTANDTKLTYKQNQAQTIDSAQEIELNVSDPHQAEIFLERIGLVVYRRQEKRRHTFIKNDVVIDIDSWPKIPPYVEFEGTSEKDVRLVAEATGFKWPDAVFGDARTLMREQFGIDLDNFRWFTFEKCG